MLLLSSGLTGLVWLRQKIYQEFSPLAKVIEISKKIVIFSVYQLQHDAIKDRRWSLRVSKAVNLFLDYHQLNSPKKSDQGYASSMVRPRIC